MEQVREDLLQRPEPQIGGVPLKRLVAIIELRENDYGKQDNGLFRPLMLGPNGARSSFLPGDLDDAEETPLRELAERCEDPIVRARLYEVLLDRFPAGRREYQRSLVSARLMSIALLSDWPDLANNVARATVLAIQAKDEHQFRAVLDSWTLVGTKVLTGAYWWPFGRIAVTFAKLVLKQRWAKTLVDVAQRQRWDMTVRWHACQSSVLTHFQRQLVLDDAGTWCALVGDIAGRVAYHREHVLDILAEARELGGLRATTHLMRAMKLATDRGLKDLLIEAKRAFPMAVAQGEAEFKRDRLTAQVRQPILDAVHEILERSPDVRTVLQALATFPPLMQLSLDEVRASATMSLEHGIAGRMWPSISYRDRKVSAIGWNADDALQKQIAFVCRLQIAENAAILCHVLERIFEPMSPSDLYEIVSGCPGLERTRIPLLATASERFRAQDWISSGVLACILYEAVLRDFMRWTGYPARAVTPDGIHADQTLGDMLRSEEVVDVLGREHVAMIVHVLGDPQYGMNLRNDVAHGTVQQEALSPDRILMVWLFMARLALPPPIKDETEGLGRTDATSADSP